MTNINNHGVIATPALVITGALALMGVGLYVAEFTGVISSNLSNSAPWGIYLAFFMLFAGVGAGCLIVAAAPKAFGLASLDLGREKELAWAGFAALLLAGVCITIDLGNPLRMLELISSPHPSSPLFWDVLALPIAIIIALVYSFGRIPQEGSAGRAARALIACWGVFVLCVDAWILCSQGARETWASSILMPWFIVTGVLCGAAVALILGAWHGKVNESLQKLTVGLIVADVLMFVLDLVCSGVAVRQMYLVGQLAPLFWGQMALYAVALVICVRQRSVSAAAAAGVIVIVGVAAKRIALLTSGFQLPAFDLPNKVAPVGALVYTPAVTEVLCAIGMLGLGLLIVFLGFKYLKLEDEA